MIWRILKIVGCFISLGGIVHHDYIAWTKFGGSPSPEIKWVVSYEIMASALFHSLSVVQFGSASTNNLLRANVQENVDDNVYADSDSNISVYLGSDIYADSDSNSTDSNVQENVDSNITAYLGNGIFVDSDGNLFVYLGSSNVQENTDSNMQENTDSNNTDSNNTDSNNTDSNNTDSNMQENTDSNNTDSNMQENTDSNTPKKTRIDIILCTMLASRIIEVITIVLDFGYAELVIDNIDIISSSYLIIICISACISNSSMMLLIENTISKKQNMDHRLIYTMIGWLFVIFIPLINLVVDDLTIDFMPIGLQTLLIYAFCSWDNRLFRILILLLFFTDINIKVNIILLPIKCKFFFILIYIIYNNIPVQLLP
jgi:hypothetical protein